LANSTLRGNLLVVIASDVVYRIASRRFLPSHTSAVHTDTCGSWNGFGTGRRHVARDDSHERVASAACRNIVH
jgi:hypothetical protein